MDYRFSDKVKNLKPSAIREIFKSLTDPEVISFAAGNPAPESFPVEELANLSNELFSDKSRAQKALQYGNKCGWFCVQKKGAISSLPTRREVEDLQ